jgi:acetyl esterase/lipase
VPTLLLVAGVVALVSTLNARWPRRDRVLLVPSFLWSWIKIELAPWFLFWEVVATVVLVANGALEESRGSIGLAAMVLAWGGGVAIILTNRRTIVTTDELRQELELDPDDDVPSFPRSHVVFPVLMRRRAGVERMHNIVFAQVDRKRLRLDVYRPAEPGTGRPGVLQIHGGAWILGDKREQGIPLLNHLAANGWVGINANYRLSPKVAFPTHLVDLKRAIAWYRTHAEELGADPDFLCVTGGSAGGHLCALVGLTANDPEYQPGFEEVDTTMRAAVPFYGVYDMTNRLGGWHPDTVRRFFEPMVMKRKMADDPEAFRKASPMDRVHADAPPFLVIHGSADTLVPPADARYFVERLRELSRQPVLYAEMQGAQHAFDVFPSYRTARVIEAAERFLHSVHRAYVEGRSAGTIEPELTEELVDD